MPDYSTYARAVLSHSKSIRSLIRKYSAAPAGSRQPQPQQIQNFEAILTLLSETQIGKALTNPQHSILGKMRLFALLIQRHRELRELQQATYQEQLTLQRRLRELQAAYENTDDIRKKIIINSINALEKEIAPLDVLQENLQGIEKTLADLDITLETMTEAHDQDWETYRKEYLQTLAKSLPEHDIPLTLLEHDDLVLQDNWDEVIRRFEIQELPMPSYININQPDALTYFELKTYLAIHASLSRRMLPHSSKEILQSCQH